jgi:hypothetical protein
VDAGPPLAIEGDEISVLEIVPGEGFHEDPNVRVTITVDPNFVEIGHLGRTKIELILRDGPIGVGDNINCLMQHGETIVYGGEEVVYDQGGRRLTVQRVWNDAHTLVRSIIARLTCADGSITCQLNALGDHDDAILAVVLSSI